MNEIKELYDKVDDKYSVINELSQKTGRTFNTIKNHWLSRAGGYSVPKRFYDLTIEVLRKHG